MGTQERCRILILKRARGLVWTTTPVEASPANSHFLIKLFPQLIKTETEKIMNNLEAIRSGRMKNMKGNRLVYGLWIVLVLTSTLMVGTSFSSNGDIELHDLDPVQVVWDQPALIANKASAVRIMIHSTFSSRVWVEINVTYDFGTQWYLEAGPEGNGVPINPGYNWVWVPGGPVYPAHDYPDPWIPSGTPPWLFWTKTGLDNKIQAEIDPLRRIEETDETNNLLTYPEVEVVQSRQLKLLWVPLADHGIPIRVNARGIDRNVAFIKETFPLAENSLLWTIRDQVYGHDSHYEFDMTESFYEEVVQDLSIEARVLGYDRIAVVYQWGVMGGCAVGILREPEDRVPVVVSNPVLALDTGEDLLAHEICHTFYLWHPFDIGPPVYDAVRYSPIRRDYERVVGNLMDYTVEETWIDKGRFDSDPKMWKDLGEVGTWQWNLWEQLTLEPIRVPVIVMSGWLFKNGAAAFRRDWYHISEGTPDLLPQAGAPEEGNYTILLLNENQQVLSQMSFNASFTYYVVPENHTLIEKETDKIPFIFNVPYFNGTKFVQIRNATSFLLAEKAITDSSPTVNVGFPNGGEELEIGNNYTITWETNDLDGDELHYLLSYSPDEGETWIPLASGLSETHFTWNTSMLLAGDKYLVKVIATDGSNIGEDQSNNTFTTLDLISPVIANVTQNPPSGSVEPSQNVTVRANVYDINSGIKNVALSYRCSSDNVTWSDWVNKTMSAVAECKFAGTIPAFSIDAHIQYQIIAKDNSNNTTINNNTGKYYVYTVIPEFSLLLALPLFMTATLLEAILFKKRMHHFSKHRKE